MVAGRWKESPSKRKSLSALNRGQRIFGARFKQSRAISRCCHWTIGETQLRPTYFSNRRERECRNNRLLGTQQKRGESWLYRPIRAAQLQPGNRRAEFRTNAIHSAGLIPAVIAAVPPLVIFPVQYAFESQPENPRKYLLVLTCADFIRHRRYKYKSNVKPTASLGKI